ncbi:MAG: hypothetical protein LBN27_04080 [Prevotellaceae bacterium]|jgi:hypothetical protein|nr:hypothetical protein [Prevotellaceae bacterium]
MVFIKDAVHRDLERIREGLLTWKIILTEEHVNAIVKDIEKACYSLEYRIAHSRATERAHLIYGAKIYRFKRPTSKTIRNIIYDIDRYGNIFVNKIM